MISTIVKMVFLVLAFCSATGAFSQNVIQRSSTPYVDRQDGQIVIGNAVPTVVAPAYRPDQVQIWEVHLSDGNLHRALTRWARADGRPVHWEAPKEFPAVYAQYKGTYVQAFEQVMKDTKHSAYQLHACEYDNLIRVLHTSKSCYQ